jgi:hypothetical protein
MDIWERAQAIAGEIYNFGEDSLFDAELGLLHSDRTFYTLVMYYLEVLKRNDKLRGENYSKQPYFRVDDEDVERILTKVFMLGDVQFEVVVYTNRRTLLSWIELKSHPNGFKEVYSHELLLAKVIRSTDVSSIRALCKNELLSRGFCSSDAEQALNEWY